MSFCSSPEVEYYDYHPNSGLHVGDIFSFKPGPKIGIHAMRFILAAPSCDIAQRKTDAVALIPVVTVHEVFSRPIMFDQEIGQRIKKVLPENLQDAFPNRTLDAKSYVDRVAGDLSDDQKIKLAPLLEWLSKLSDETPTTIDLKLVEKCLGSKDLSERLGKIHNDNYRSDFYFLPKTKQKNGDQISLKNGGVALLRNITTVPFELLDLATDPDREWDNQKDLGCYKSAHYFLSCPIKVGTIKGPFCNDLYSRFLAFQVRTGSPDFIPAYVDLAVRNLVPVVTE